MQARETVRAGSREVYLVHARDPFYRSFYSSAGAQRRFHEEAH